MYFIVLLRLVEPAAQLYALDRSSYSRRARKKSTAESNFSWKNWGQTGRSPISIRLKNRDVSVRPGFPVFRPRVKTRLLTSSW